MSAAELRATALAAADPAELLIGGDWRGAGGGGRFMVEDPASGEPVAEVADAGVEDACAALDAAAAAQRSWAKTAPRERAEILRRAFDLVVEQQRQLSVLITAEMGKPLAESEAEVAYGAEFLRWFSEEAVRIGGRYLVSPAGEGRVLTMQAPVGPCLLITPWNFPLAMATRKIAPALAAGCTAVVKPAQLTPLTTVAFARILQRAGLPPGVLNVITSSSARRVTEPLIADPRLRKLSFTGSTPVGKQLAAAAAAHMVRVSMELGGNAPFIVFADADIDHAVDQAAIAKMRNGGQSCVAANRFYVADSLAMDFSERLAARLAEMTVGPGLDAETELGPLIDAGQRADVEELVADARRRGTRLLGGGDPLPGPGYFYEPTVLYDPPRQARLLNEEIFGPVAPIVPLSDPERSVELANATPYGLVAYVFTRDIERALKICEGLEVGMIGLNRGLVSNAAAPFGGVKDSGLGREGGREGIEEYLETKYVAIDLPS